MRIDTKRETKVNLWKKSFKKKGRREKKQRTLEPQTPP